MLEKLLLAIGLTFSLSVFPKVSFSSQKQAVQQFEPASSSTLVVSETLGN